MIEPSEIKSLAKGITGAVKEHIANALRGIGERLDKLEQKLAELPRPEKGDRGEKGEDGRPGTDGKDGKDGRDGKDGLDGKDGAAGPAGKDAQIDYELVIAESVKRIPVPKDGIDGLPGKDGKDGKDGIDGKNGESIVGPKGADGRDALQIDVLSAPEVTKSYSRGIFARFDGGIIRSFRDTVPGDFTERGGWEVAMNGIADHQVTISEDCRTIAVITRTTAHEKAEHTFAIPALIYRGVWAPGTFAKGDVVTWGGSAWHSQVNDNKSEPGKNDDWKLMVKEGRRGKDGPEGKQGPPGPQGRNGKDIIGNR